MALTTDLLVRLSAALTSPLDLVTAAAPLDLTTRIQLASGTGAGAADMLWSDTRTLAASATEDLDLAASLTGPLGGTLTFAKVKLLYVTAAAGNTNDVVVSRAAAGIPLFAATGDSLPVKPGGCLLWCAPNATGVAVTATTADTVTVTNSAGGTGVTYSIVVIGASA